MQRLTLLLTMPVFLATSCLQGRPLQQACEQLLALEPEGLQLTGGHAPTRNFDEWLASSEIPILRHHGFSSTAYAQQVWGERGELLGEWNSVHPPKHPSLGEDMLTTVLEVMYPGCQLGTGVLVEDAMCAGQWLAIDVSHVHIQIEQGAMTMATWRRLCEYTRVAEIHVSANDGRRDSHRPIEANSFGLEWARERSSDGTPMVLESYMHRLSDDARRWQVELLFDRPSQRVGFQ